MRDGARLLVVAVFCRGVVGRSLGRILGAVDGVFRVVQMPQRFLHLFRQAIEVEDHLALVDVAHRISRDDEVAAVLDVDQKLVRVLHFAYGAGSRLAVGEEHQVRVGLEDEFLARAGEGLRRLQTM